MKVYIAGAITNEPQYKEKFYDAVLALKTEGHITLNPSELPRGLTNADYMRICLSMIDVADMVAFIPGWEDSEGASLEHSYCQYTDKKTLYLMSYEPYQKQCSIGSFIDRDGFSF